MIPFTLTVPTCAWCSIFHSPFPSERIIQWGNKRKEIASYFLSLGRHDDVTRCSSQMDTWSREDWYSAGSSNFVICCKKISIFCSNVFDNLWFPVSSLQLSAHLSRVGRFPGNACHHHLHNTKEKYWPENDLWKEQHERIVLQVESWKKVKTEVREPKRKIIFVFLFLTFPFCWLWVHFGPWEPQVVIDFFVWSN